MLAISLMLTVVCTLPLWLVGALAIQMRQELAFSITALGGAVAIFRLAGALAAIPLGRLSDRLGPVAALRTAAALAAIASLGIAVQAHTWGTLVLWLAVSGAANSLGQTAANLALVRTVPLRRQGTAFGVKQSALPFGTLLAGLSVPLIALTVGWRWAFVLAAVLAIAVGVAVPRGRARRYARPTGTQNRRYGKRPLVVLSIAVFFGMGAASTVTTFIVESSAAAGVSPAAAGLILTVGSAVSIVSRLIAGAMADRRGGAHFRAVGRMQIVGALGFLLLAIHDPFWIIPGSILAFAFSWGYHGLFWYALVRLNQATPAAATGLVMPGGMLGGLFGPLAFGWIAESSSYQIAWLLAAFFSVAAGLCMFAGRALLQRDLRTFEAAA
ncbi:MAG: MFS transporter [Propionibacteriales bacterium]|nr:MFS transporter [Propionibacteriales bacterium]